ncbi:class I SAM-dependent methyltransferase [Campylobacter volucris]|uniref:class I SAM-dependent methyltransferase n=1 Tax=Campylobacter volucris TaxID=1031542 RepID=UPI0018A07868|nr:class I SAM-dependent methyltransferase [Campylobacter volucris]MBF7049138.1 class I SAM-dependent methyltransferase [Campylobacter volucris]MBF7060345.1 class I SAM-dependent methyltransferase [Campylobacter volucris]
MKQGDFSEVAKHYHNRPAYSSMLIEKLIKCVNDKNKPILNVVEVGAGTGKLTKMLADDFNLNINAIEPNDNMREEGIKFTQNSKNIIWHKGSGEETNMPSASADWVIMASSFHWTDPKKSLPEFARVLNGGGYFTAIWNPRHIIKGSVFYEIEEEIKNIIPELNRVSSGTQNVKKWEEILVSTGDFKDCFFMECDYFELMDKQRYLGAWHSVNDIQAQAGKERWEEILKMIENKISSMDMIKIPYKIRAWTVKKA